MKTDKWIHAVALLVVALPSISHAAKERSIKIECEKHIVTIFDGSNTILLSRNPAKGPPSKVDNFKFAHGEMGGNAVIKTDFVEFAEAGGTYTQYSLYTFDNEASPTVLTSEWRNADDVAIRPPSSEKCKPAVVSMQVKPKIKSVREAQGW